MSEKNFDEILGRLNEIVGLLEKNELSMDESLAIFEEGLKLIKSGEGKLENFEKRINVLIKENE